MGLFVQNFYHLPDNLRPLLQIRVNEGDVFSVCVLEPSVQSGFLSEITGEGNHLYGALLGCMELFQIMKGRILGAIVNKHNFVIIAAAGKGRQHRLLERGHIFRFVIAGNNKGQLHGNHLRSECTPIICAPIPAVKTVSERTYTAIFCRGSG